MAFFHASINIISRGAGHSALAAAAYRAAENIGIYQYANRRGVHGAEIMYPDNAPEWVKAMSRAELWQSVEEAEKRKDAQLARAGDFALPRELSWEQNEELTRGFIKEFWTDRGMVCDVAYHIGKNDENPHIHPAAPLRRAEAEGWGKKERAWNDKAWLQAVREGWEKHVNAALERAGIDARIDHRSLAAQGIDREPQRHKGRYWTHLDNQAKEIDDEILRLEQKRAELAAEIIAAEQTTKQPEIEQLTSPRPAPVQVKRYDPTALSPEAEARRAAKKAADRARQEEARQAAATDQTTEQQEIEQFTSRPKPAPVQVKRYDPTALSPEAEARRAAKKAADRARQEEARQAAATDQDNQDKPNVTETVQAPLKGQEFKDARTALLKIAWRVQDKKPAFVQLYNNAPQELKSAIDDILTTKDTTKQRQTAEKHLQSPYGADIAKTAIALRKSAELSR